MRLARRYIVPAALVLLAAGSTQVGAQTTAPTNVKSPSLTVGSAAPELKVANWFKGTPVASFEPGHVYVVEFWATWCGPCKKNIPHLTELAKKYAGKVSVIGVDVWERPQEKTDAALATIGKTFVDSMGDKMDYLVAGDDAQGTMAKTWMAAAGKDAIPAAFVVDGSGKIAWTGMPAEMDAVLESVTKGTWDIAAELRRLDAVAAAKAEEMKWITPVLEARRNKDPKGVLTAFEVGEKNDPGMMTHPDLLSMRLQALLELSHTDALDYITKISAADGLLMKKNWNWAVLRVIPLNGEKQLTTDEYKTIAVAMAPVMKAAKPNVHEYSTYAKLLYAAGDTKSAVEYQKKTVELSAEFANDERMTSFIEQQKQALAQYQTN